MQGYTIQFPVLGHITSFLFSHSRDLGLSSGGSVDIKSAWSSSRRGHQVGVVIMSVWSSCRCGHQVGVVIKSAWSSSRRGHQVGVVIKSAWSSSRRGHQVGVDIKSAWSPSRRGQQVGRLVIWWSLVRFSFWSLAGFVLGRPDFKSPRTLVNSRLVASC